MLSDLHVKAWIDQLEGEIETRIAELADAVNGMAAETECPDFIVETTLRRVETADRQVAAIAGLLTRIRERLQETQPPPDAPRTA